MTTAAQTKPVVLVTGCSQGGIGFALCEEFAARGCTVYATARRLETLKGFQSPNIKAHILDVNSDENVEALVQVIVETEGRIDLLVNNAGVMCVGALLDMPLDQVRKTFETNTFSILRLARAVVPHMAKRRKGTIVNIGSVTGNVPTPWVGIYAASKAAVHAITEVLWMECKALDIDVMLVAPGAVKSNLADNQNSSFSIPEDSLFKSYLQSMIHRLYLSQEPSSSMPADKFSKQVVSAALAARPQRYLTLGGKSFLFMLALWLPRTLLLTYIWKRFLKRK